MDESANVGEPVQADRKGAADPSTQSPRSAPAKRPMLHPVLWWDTARAAAAAEPDTAAPSQAAAAPLPVWMTAWLRTLSSAEALRERVAKLQLPRPRLPRPRLPSPRLPQVRLALPELASWVRVALRGIVAVSIGLVAAVLALVLAYRWINPPISALMLSQSLAGTSIERAWVPLERVSPNLVRAVVLSEDAAFCRHHGVDWPALQEAMESDRGGSTITMQVVKNLFLWPSRSYVRKAIEIGLAYLVEAVWPKRRILEIYLNIAEWGDGVFGAEAAARANFEKPASRLTADEAALMAVALPNPLERTPAAPNLVSGRLASRLLARMATARADFSCLPVPRAAAKQAHLFPAGE